MEPGWDTLSMCSISHLEVELTVGRLGEVTHTSALSLSFPSPTKLCVPEARGVLEGQLQSLTLNGGHSSKVGMDTLSLSSDGVCRKEPRPLALALFASPRVRE